jgi:capsular exopolysaccharide synthesis family protein
VSKVFEALTQQNLDVPASILPAIAEIQSLTVEARVPDGPAAARPLVRQLEPEKLLGLPKAAPAPPNGVPDLPQSGPAPEPFGKRYLSLSLDASAPLLPFDSAHRYAAEQYLTIRTRILQHARAPRCIVLTSASQGDGKSVTAFNLAAALSLRVNTSTVLIDADLRRSSIHKQLGFPISPGLAGVLEGKNTLQDSLISVKEIPGLTVLAAGESAVSPVDLPDSPQWKRLCSELKQRFDYVVIDSAPAAVVADFDLVQKECDGVILVVRPNHSLKPLYQRDVDSIPKEKLIGAVVNCAEEWILWRPSRHKASYGAYLQT